MAPVQFDSVTVRAWSVLAVPVFGSDSSSEERGVPLCFRTVSRGKHGSCSGSVPENSFDSTGSRSGS